MTVVLHSHFEVQVVFAFRLKGYRQSLVEWFKGSLKVKQMPCGGLEHIDLSWREIEERKSDKMQTLTSGTRAYMQILSSLIIRFLSLLAATTMKLNSLSIRVVRSSHFRFELSSFGFLLRESSLLFLFFFLEQRARLKKKYLIHSNFHRTWSTWAQLRISGCRQSKSF